MSLRERLAELRDQEQRTIDFFEDPGVAELDAEFRDISAETIQESRRRVELYNRLINKFERLLGEA